MNNIEKIWYLYPRYVQECKLLKKDILTPKEFGQKYINSSKRKKRR